MKRERFTRKRTLDVSDFTGDPMDDLPGLIAEEGVFTVTFSPIANDPTCKITVGINEFLLTIEQMKSVVIGLEA